MARPADAQESTEGQPESTARRNLLERAPSLVGDPLGEVTRQTRDRLFVASLLLIAAASSSLDARDLTLLGTKFRADAIGSIKWAFGVVIVYWIINLIYLVVYDLKQKHSSTAPLWGELRTKVEDAWLELRGLLEQLKRLEAERQNFVGRALENTQTAWRQEQVHRGELQGQIDKLAADQTKTTVADLKARAFIAERMYELQVSMLNVPSADLHQDDNWKRAESLKPAWDSLLQQIHETSIFLEIGGPLLRSKRVLSVILLELVPAVGLGVFAIALAVHLRR